MAQQKRNKRNTVRYHYASDGSAALQPEIRRPERTGRTGPSVRPSRRKEKQPEVRQTERLSVFGVVGMMAVAVLALFTVALHVQLDHVYAEAGTLNSQLEELKEQENQLQLQYEQMFDMNAIEAQMLAGGRMTKPLDSQIVYLDLAEEDHAQVFRQDSWASALMEKVRGGE